MALQIPVVEAIGSFFKGIFGLVDDLHTSEEEKLALKGQMFMAQGDLLARVFDYEKSMLEMKASIITAEANSESWITRSWRPIAMLTLLALLVFHWLGLTSLATYYLGIQPTVTPEMESQFMTLLQIGLGGYVVSRVAEKVAKSINFNKATETE